MCARTWVPDPTLEIKFHGFFLPNCEVVALSNIDQKVHFFHQPRTVLWPLWRHVFCVRRVTITRKEQRHCCGYIWDAAQEREEYEGDYHGALSNTNVYWSDTRVFSTSENHPLKYSSIHHTTTSPYSKDLMFVKKPWVTEFKIIYRI